MKSINMLFWRRLLWGLILSLGMTTVGVAQLEPGLQSKPTSKTQVAQLERKTTQLQRAAEARRTPLYQSLLKRTDGPQGALNRNLETHLIGTRDGRPIFYETHNVVSAQTIGVDRVWPGGDTGLDLTGANLSGELAVWDAGRVMETHQEFGGRVVSQDGMPNVHYHATHVGGTMIAAGVDSDARGMSYQGVLDSYDWIDDEVEMSMAAASGLRVSNHSYGSATGWRWNSSDDNWYWYGDPDVSEVEDPGFGFYSSGTRDWDEIAWFAPHYLIVKSAGNDRNDSGPEAGGEHYVWDYNFADWVLSTTTRNADGAPDGYDTIGFRGNGKNILTVGAVEDIPGGWTHASDVIATSFTGWGPSDDGRIKPDLVANGSGLYSCYIDDDFSYAHLSGTSMSAPSVSGAANLLVQAWAQAHPGAPDVTAAALKAVLIHTTHEAGPAEGPDYQYGWGLADIATAGQLIADDGLFEDRVTENNLVQGQTDTHTFWCDGSTPIRATLCWSDPAGTPPTWSVDPTDAMLVNDLDLRIERVSNGQVSQPWILDPLNPTTAATTGDNIRDNVEQVLVSVPAVGLYRVTVSHKGVLSDGNQSYALVVSGLGAEPDSPEVSAVNFSQRTDGSGLVDIGYTVSDLDSPAVTVSLEASLDGGLSWTLPMVTLSGDVGAGVAVGNDKAVIWDFATDNPDLFLADVVIKVIADDGR